MESKEYNCKLISLVSKHEALFNDKHPDRRRRAVQNKLWDDIASKMKTPVAEVKKRWVYLRNFFRKKYSLVYNLYRITGFGPLEDYPYYKQLMFLAPHIKIMDAGEDPRYRNICWVGEDNDDETDPSTEMTDPEGDKRYRYSHDFATRRARNTISADDFTFDVDGRLVPIASTSPSPFAYTSTSPPPFASTNAAPLASNNPTPLASTSPAPLASTRPASLTPTRPASLASTKPAPLASTRPASLTSAIAKSLAPARPAPLASTRPTPLASTRPAPLASTKPAPLAPTRPASLASTRPSPLVSARPAPLASSNRTPLASISPAPLTSTRPAPLTSSTLTPLASTRSAPLASTRPTPSPSTTTAPLTSTGSAPLASTRAAHIASSSPAPLASSSQVPLVSTSPAPAPSPGSLPRKRRRTSNDLDQLEGEMSCETSVHPKLDKFDYLAKCVAEHLRSLPDGEASARIKRLMDITFPE